MSIESYGYTGGLPRYHCLKAIGEAFDDAAMVHEASDSPIGVDQLVYTFADVERRSTRTLQFRGHDSIWQAI